MERGRVRKASRGRITAVFGLGVTAVLAIAGLYAPSVFRQTTRPPRTARVTRGDLAAVIVAPGRLESVRSTEISCGIERVSGAGDTTILKLVEDGSTVKKGDLLCELDASVYEELVRRQQITVDQARSTYKQAQLTLESAQIELQVFQEGEVIQTERLYQGQIALARSDLTRQGDRLDWTKRMLEKGYLPLVQVSTEEQTLRRAQLTLKQNETAFNNFQRFSVPKSLKMLQSSVNGAEATFGFETIRLQREEQRLALYKSLVDRCKIHAPHDGLVIHANRNGRSPEVFEGAIVRQRQRLFSLPDLSEMEVEVMLHETIVSQVGPGLPVRVVAEPFPDLVLTGKVVSVAPLPYNEGRRQSGTDVTFFVGKIKLDRTPPGLRPGMTAQIEVCLETRKRVLTVPLNAARPFQGENHCRVVAPDHVELRPVKLGTSSHESVEILDGLREGETVLLSD